MCYSHFSFSFIWTQIQATAKRSYCSRICCSKCCLKQGLQWPPLSSLRLGASAGPAPSLRISLPPSCPVSHLPSFSPPCSPSSAATLHARCPLQAGSYKPEPSLQRAPGPPEALESAGGRAAPYVPSRELCASNKLLADAAPAGPRTPLWGPQLPSLSCDPKAQAAQAPPPPHGRQLSSPECSFFAGKMGTGTKDTSPAGRMSKGKGLPGDNSVSWVKAG